MGKQWKLRDFLFWGSKITADSDYSCDIKRCLFLGRKPMTNLSSILKSRDIPWPTKFHLLKAMIFPVVMCGCESWTIKKAECWWTVVLEKTLESPLDCKEIKPVNPKGNQPWIVIGRTDAEAEAPILWPPNEKSQLIEKDLDAGKDWRLCFISKDKQKLLAVLLIEISVWKWNLGHLFCCILLWKEHLFWFFKLFFSKDNAYIWQKGRH